MGNHHPYFSVMLYMSYLHLNTALPNERNRKRTVMAVDAFDATFTVS